MNKSKTLENSSRVFLKEGVYDLDRIKQMLTDLEKLKESEVENNPFEVFPKPVIIEALKLLEEYSEEFKI